jgi:YidC/Oxa1 family membrane protein insertase
MFQLEVSIENSVNEFVPLNFGGYAYTVGFGPQIGPRFEKLDQRNEWRRYQIFNDGKARNQNLGREGVKVVDERVRWAAISGKYFSVIGVPDATDYDIVFSGKEAEGVPEGSQMYFSRPVIRSSRNTDRFRFFVGPKVPTVLRQYDDAEDNAFGTNNLELTGVLETRFLLGWLENILKFILQLINRVVPNYGIAIIILTILVKALLWPLTHKSYQSTAKMQSLAPKIQEIKDKYSDNPNKVNQETAALYKKEGVNPLGGCLPMLLQFPFFIAMFGLFNNHFDLRGATFIPGWIDDLSSPESILNFGDFTLPILGWNDLRLLPIIFVGTQLITSKITQTPSSGSNSQMKMMTYALPIVFFFILYNMPSGLLVYWIFSNVLTAGQQYYNNTLKQKRREP